MSMLTEMGKQAKEAAVVLSVLPTPRKNKALCHAADALLAAKDATVTICHSKTKDLQEKCRQADILVCAIGKAGFVTKDMVKEGAIVVDVGINRNAEGKLCGDAAKEVEEVAGYLTPVPGGVGLMTRAMLMKNTLVAAQQVKL